MSCFFCQSDSHLSQNCDYFVTDESRWRYCCFLNRCCYCLNSNKNHDLKSFQCIENRKCFTCFSKKHHTFFCPFRFTNSELFFPKIDKDLSPRFLQMFEPMEKYSMAFTSPSTIPFELKPLKVIKSIPDQKCKFPRHTDSNFVFINEIEIYYPLTSKPYKELRNIITSGRFISQAEIINIKNSEMSPKEFLCLISCFSRNIICYNLKITSKITLAEILQKAPNIENLDLLKTNLIFDDSWIDVLLEYGNGYSLRKLTIAVENYNIDVEKLFTFFKERTNGNIQIFVRVDHSCLSPSEFSQFREMMSSKLSKYFIQSETLPPIFCIDISEHPIFGHYPALTNFALNYNI